MELAADEGCSYDGEMELNLSELVPSAHVRTSRTT